VVASGDTLYAISRRTKVPVDTLIETNRLEPPYLLVPGQRLRLPGGESGEGREGEGRAYVVREGDTLYAVSRCSGVPLAVLAHVNGLAPPYPIAPGQRLHLPPEAAADCPGTVAVAEAETKAATKAEAKAEPAPDKAEQAWTPPAAKPPPPVKPRPATVIPAALPGPIPQPPARAGTAFLWPVEGKVVSSFGPKAGARQNDGINIAAAEGAPVRAAENGVVVYAGNELRGYGNLLLIRHADGWTSAYAHNAELLVGRGAVVERGQVIAHVGRTGSVTSPQSHFELRKGAKAVDPVAFLGPR